MAHDQASLLLRTANYSQADWALRHRPKECHSERLLCAARNLLFSEVTQNIGRATGGLDQYLYLKLKTYNL